MPKRIIEGKVWTRGHKIFRIGKVAPSEEVVLLHFGRKTRYEVVKLSISDLPSKAPGRSKKIRWLNNFGVRDAKGKYVKKVNYTVFLRARKKGVTLVYHDHRGLHWGKTPTRKGSKPARSGMIQLDFKTGDPAIGEG